MAGDATPVDLTAFDAFGMRALTADGFDAALADTGDALAVVFFWGIDCYNCEVAKRTMLLHRADIAQLDLMWFHANVYEERALATRFALHGVPSFFFFHRGRKLGRVTGWQGLPQFKAAVAAAREKIRESAAPPSKTPSAAGS